MDGRYIAFVGGFDSPAETYFVRAGGSALVRRLTKSKRLGRPYGTYSQEDGTVPLAGLSPDALAVGRHFSLGILRLDGSFRSLCRRQGMTFSSGTALP